MKCFIGRYGRNETKRKVPNRCRVDTDNSMKDNFRISVRRQGPNDSKPVFSSYTVPSSPQMSVLDALKYIKENIDGTIAFNYSCQKQRCGSCALVINNRIALACYTRARDNQVVSPLEGFPIVRDLVVDWGPYEKRFVDLIPLMTARGREIQNPSQESSKKKEEKKTKKRRSKLAESAMTCIKCYSCVGACPSVDIKNPSGFAGPAISVMLASYLDRDEGSVDLLSPAKDSNLQFCTKCYECNAVCPAEINIVGCIDELLRMSSKEDPASKQIMRMTRGPFS
jgi:succinate dehydrogenase/fumarate reductase iron-sulfur protein